MGTDGKLNELGSFCGLNSASRGGMAATPLDFKSSDCVFGVAMACLILHMDVNTRAMLPQMHQSYSSVATAAAAKGQEAACSLSNH